MSKRFAYVRPSQEAVETMNAFRLAFAGLEDRIDVALPNHSKYKDRALSSLEGAFMWLERAITHGDPAASASAHATPHVQHAA